MGTTAPLTVVCACAQQGGEGHTNTKAKSLWRSQLPGHRQEQDLEQYCFHGVAKRQGQRHQPGSWQLTGQPLHDTPAAAIDISSSCTWLLHARLSSQHSL